MLKNIGLTYGAVALTGVFSVCEAKAPASSSGVEQLERPNILLIVADDLNCSSTSMFGCEVADVTPNIARLAGEGVLFRNAHVTTGVSQPSRGTMTTGLYPHNSGIDGFYRSTKDIASLQESLQAADYKIGIIGKNAHSTPKPSIKWDLAIDGKEASQGRNPELYAATFADFLKSSNAAGHPVFFMANSHDPHRPFSGSEQEAKKFPTKPFKTPSRSYGADEIEVPGFLPELDGVKKEIAQYFSSVKRLDDTVGALLQAVEQSGVADNTIVVFLSDNGMSVPFAKSNCYLHSTHTPLIIKAPGAKMNGRGNSRDMISTVHLMPTLLDLAGVDIPKNLDGQSIAALLDGSSVDGCDYAFTEYMENSSNQRFPMRAVQDDRYAYIFNGWSDGERVYKAESKQGLTYTTMVEAAKAGDEEAARRVAMLDYRVKEEFYDLRRDPDGLVNLVDDPKMAKVVAEYVAVLQEQMRKSNDPMADIFANRYDDEAVKIFMIKQQKIGAAHKAKKLAGREVPKWKLNKKQ